MAINALAYAKALEAAGVDRAAAEAHAEAPTRCLLPDPATRAGLEHPLERLEHRLIVRLFGMMLGIVGLMEGVLLALPRAGQERGP
jgi:hypothetical protein